MDLATLFAHHVERLQAETEKALAETGHASLVVSSGAPITYFADDQDAPFHPTPHFAHWCPLGGPHHVVHVVPGRRPRLLRYAPEDYWYEQGGVTDPFWLGAFELEEAGTLDAVWKAPRTAPGAAYLGNEIERAGAAGLDANPGPLVARLDWARSYKDEYEVLCIEEATAVGARAHRAAREAFAAGGSELEIHDAFVSAAGTTEAQLPYPTIVALDEKAATLHYERKRYVARRTRAAARRRGREPRVRVRHHAHHDRARLPPALRRSSSRSSTGSSRSWRARPPPAAPTSTCTSRRTTVSRACSRRSASSAWAPRRPSRRDSRTPSSRTASATTSASRCTTWPGARRIAAGTPAPPPKEHPYLRNTRTIEPGQVFTIEPGIYFIPMLLRPLRGGPLASAIDWSLVDALTPLGGVRVEDNVLVTAAGPRNLTREVLPD